MLRTQPYRLQARVDADFLRVHDALAAGRIRDAARAHRGSAVALVGGARGTRGARRARRSGAPGRVVQRRRRSDVGAEIPAGTADGGLARVLLRALPSRDPRHALLAARLGIP